MNSIEKTFRKFNISGYNWFLSDELLSLHTTFKIGGRARFFAVPPSIEALICLFAAIKESGISYYVLGGGSNVIMPDDGFDGVVISTVALTGISQREAPDGGVLVESGCGVPTAELADYLCEKSLAGFATFAGLPGSIGGAVFMNARCYGTEISDLIVSVMVFDIATETVRTIPFDSSQWSYKKSPFQNAEMIVLSVVFLVQSGLKTVIRAEMDGYIADRTVKGHFRFPSAGSVFKNNRDFGKPSGVLIDESGGKGISVGGIQVAPWHGNFFINTGSGTAHDVQSLVTKVRQLVMQKTGFILECEIIFVENCQKV